MTLRKFIIILVVPCMTLGGAALAQSEQTQSASEQSSGQSSQGMSAGQQASDQAKQAQGDAAENGGSAAQAGMIIKQQESSQVLASSIVGMAVQNGTGEKAEQIGDIADLILNESNQVVGVLIGVGGFLGIGEKYVGVPWSAVQVNPEKGTTIVELSRKQLEQAPAFATLAEQKEKQQRQQMKQKMQQQRQQQSQGMSG